MKTHSPGPWVFYTNPIMRTSVVAFKADGPPITKNIQPENAALIAASPDMLSALRLAKAWMDEDFDQKMTEHDMAVYDETMEAINTAIQKATQP